MATAIKSERFTLADDLRRLLARGEDRLIDLSSQADAAELFALLDQIARLWPEARATGADVRGEEARWQGLQERLVARGSQVLRAWQGSAGLEAARHAAAPDHERWWWWLDQIMADKRRARLRRVALAALAAVAVVAAAVFILQRLFPVDPAVREAYRLQTAADVALAGGDLQSAFDSYSQAIEVDPQDYRLYVTHGVLAAVLGQSAVAERSWQQARALLASDEARFLTERSLAYLRAQQAQQAVDDAQAAIALDPGSAQAQLFLGGALEALGRYQEAVQAYEQASALADAADNAQLVVIARTQLAQLMQRIQAAPVPTSQP